MSVVPTDLITGILSRLPVKNLVRFKCVSKPWSSLIDGSYLSNLQLHRSFTSNANIKLLLDSYAEDDEYKAYSVDFDSLDKLEELPRLLSTTSFGVSSRIFGSCNGLLAISHDEAGITLWSPSTKECHYPPKLTIGDMYDEIILGFSYDVINNDYKVVQMLSSGNSVHWVGIENDKDDDARVIFGLDIGIEEFHQLPGPDISYKNFRYRSVGILGGSLCVFRDIYHQDNIVLWVMKEYGVRESWTEDFFVSHDECWQWCMYYTRAISYSRRGDRVLLDDGGRPRQPAWFNLDKRTREVVDIPGATKHFNAIIFVESLASVLPGNH
ncbi:hypothetical protein Goshw_017295 [Gossypium schwendimanii]|uniref:F-box domain-containing protein n=1 Tax=Gossypium schwendimanii TaxID=34291 RepID=A0A7J9KSZ6_GOSSC|nr:hypothetical protein [Gossypium schwendimanii]